MKINIYNKLYYLSYFLLLIYTLCNRVTFLIPVLPVLKYIIPIFLVLLILIQSRKYKLNCLMIVFMLMALSFVVFLRTKEEFLLCTILYILAAKDVKIDEFIKKDVKYKLFILLFVIICYKLGLTSSNIFSRSDGTIRNTLGFAHPNQLGLCLFSISCGIAFIHYKKYKITDYLIFIMSLIICHSVCDSRSSFFGILIVLLIALFRKFIENNKLINKLIVFLPEVLFLLSLLFTILYTNNFQIAYDVNKVLNSRLYHASAFLNYYGINLFGHYFDYYGLTNLRYDLRGLTILDNAYMHILIHFGVIQTVLVLLFKDYEQIETLNLLKFGVCILIVITLF